MMTKQNFAHKGQQLLPSEQQPFYKIAKYRYYHTLPNILTRKGQKPEYQH